MTVTKKCLQMNWWTTITSYLREISNRLSLHTSRAKSIEVTFQQKRFFSTWILNAKRLLLIIRFGINNTNTTKFAFRELPISEQLFQNIIIGLKEEILFVWINLFKKWVYISFHWTNISKQLNMFRPQIPLLSTLSRQQLFKVGLLVNRENKGNLWFFFK